MPVSPEILVGSLLLAILASLAYKMGFLDLLGMVSAFLVGLTILVGGGWGWLLILVTFFVVASLFTKYRYDAKREMGAAQEKGGARSWPNVLANGGVASALAIGELLLRGDLLAIAFLGAMATSLADTLATEIGLLSKAKPRLITRPSRLVKKGTSGGITILGLAAALLGAGLIAFLGSAFLGIKLHPLKLGLLILLAGFVGSLMDSLLGATLQFKGRCRVCGQETEAWRHHGYIVERLRGFKWLNNDVVNLSSSAFGALVAILLLPI